MTVTAEDRFKVSIAITVTNNATGEQVTETTHTDNSLDYGSMQIFRQVVLGAINDETGKLGQGLAESFGQGGAAAFLNGIIGKVTGPGAIR